LEQKKNEVSWVVVGVEVVVVVGDQEEWIGPELVVVVVQKMVNERVDSDN
jgi:hypothetical protein